MSTLKLNRERDVDPAHSVSFGKGSGTLQNQNPGPWRAFSIFGSIGIQLAILIVAGFYGGRWLDSVMGTSPVFLIVGILCGVAVGIMSMILLIKRFLGGGS